MFVRILVLVIGIPACRRLFRPGDHDERTLSPPKCSILDFIEQFLVDNDYPPTIRDIQRELGISSTSVVDYNLKILEDGT